MGTGNRKIHKIKVLQGMGATAHSMISLCRVSCAVATLMTVRGGCSLEVVVVGTTDVVLVVDEGNS